jgi:hypothetical protein
LNIFYLSEEPSLAAFYHCDKHVVKMAVETVQILSTALFNVGVEDKKLYRPTHRNHPCVLWAMQRRNGEWLYSLGVHLMFEYKSRYGRDHRSGLVLPLIEPHLLKLIDNGCGFSAPPQCMPDDCKQADCVEAYREYYRKYKTFAKWKFTGAPYWYNK